MAEDLKPTADSHSPRVYVGAHVPLYLYTLLVEEAERTMVTRSDVIRWALAERYKKQVASHSAALRGLSGGKLEDTGDREQEA